MKFEIDPNELTTDQRAHVAAFITNWPHADEVDHAGEAELRRHARIYGDVTEEQRLDTEQKRDMDTTGEQKEELSAADECRKIGSQIASDNLNAIFSAPVTKEMGQLIEERKALISDIMHNTVPLDKEGLPWDSRIHASTKTFIADGSWKLRRGVDPISVEMIKHQLKELMAVPQPLATAYLKGALSGPIDDVVHSTSHVNYDPAIKIPTPSAPVFTPTSVEYVPHVDVATYTPPIPLSNANTVGASTTIAAPGVVTLTDMIARMSSAIVAGKMTQATVAEMCAKHGVSEFMLLSNRPDLLPLIDADMKALGV